ncbi:MAG: oxygenase MpaB family protein [Pseudomonadota bacterium]|nr:oxygenase MpaB family protein [Pseudomonadota bacterium]
MSAIQPVTREALIAQLEDMKGQVIDPQAGIFGPDSMFWRVVRHSASFMGAGRAVLLQTAHPWIANGVKQHSRTLNDPISRFRGTFTNVFTMVFGNLDQVVESALRVHDIHRKIVGKVEEDSGAFAAGSRYMANEVNAMIWVHATLWEGAVKMYETYVGTLSKEDKEQYYLESKMFAYLFGIPEDALPPNWDEFLEYNEKMWYSDQLNVQAAAKEIAKFLFSIHKPLRPMMNRYKVVTSMLMPEPVRVQYGLPEDTPENQAIFQRNLRIVRRVYPLLPRHLRYLPPYNEAMRRLKGKHSPGLITGGLNKLVLGQASLVSA